MKNLLCIILLKGVALLSAQPSIQWQKTYGGSSYDEAKDIRQTSDGGYILTGKTFSNNGDVFGHHGGLDFWVLKLTSTGNIQWKKALGGSQNDLALSVEQTVDNGFFVAGFASSNDFDVSGNHGGLNDGWVVKLSETGAIEWQKTLGGSGRDEIWSAQQTSDQGYILTGRSNSFDGDVTSNKGKLDVWVVKLSKTGTLEWQKSFGGSEDDFGNAVKQTLDGGYIISAQTSSTDGDVIGNHGNVDFWVLKLSQSGTLEWQKTFGGENADIPSDVIMTPEGGYVVVGYTGSHNTGDVTGHQASFDFWIVKLNADGVLEWQKAIGGTQPDWGEAVVPATGGGFVIAGTTYSSDGDVESNHGAEDFWLAKISEQGDLLWQKTFGGTMGDECYGIANTADNGFVLAGLTWSTNGDISGSLNHGQNDFWVIKLSPEPSTPTTSPSLKINCFPNPAQASVTLQIPSAGALLTVNIYDLLGRAILCREVIPNGGQLHVANLQEGVYFVAADDGNGTVWWGKLEKE